MGESKRRSEAKKRDVMAKRERANTRHATGHAYFVRFPFTIHTKRERASPYDMQIGANRIRIYWPYVSGGGNAPKQLQAEWVGAPVPYGADPIEEIWPKLDVKGFPVYRGHEGEYVQADSLRIDVWPVPEGGDLEQLVTRFTGLLRWWTHQWWIGRDDRFRLSPASTTLAIDDSGQIVNTTFNAFTMATFYGYERLLDASAFGGACLALQRGISIPYAYAMMFDASYYQAVADYERFVMAISISCDAAILHAAQRMADKKGIDIKVYERRLDPQNQLYNLDKALKDIIGASFKEEEPTAYETLALIWRVRGRVAHGKSPTLSESGTQRRLTGEERIAAIDAAGALVSMLEKYAGSPGAM